MKPFLYPVRELSLRCWGWKLLFGPAGLVDGLVETFTFGLVGVGCRLAVSRNLARVSFEAIKAHRAAMANKMEAA